MAGTKLVSFVCRHCGKQINEGILVPSERDSLTVYSCPYCREFIKETKK